MLGYNQNIFIDSIFITLQNGQLYYCQLFHSPPSVEYLRLDCKAGYTNANQGTMPEGNNITVQYTQSNENDLNNTFYGRIAYFSVLFFGQSQLKQMFQFRSESILERQCQNFPRGVNTFNNQYYVLMFTNVQLESQHRTTLCVHQQKLNFLHYQY